LGQERCVGWLREGEEPVLEFGQLSSDARMSLIELGDHEPKHDLSESLHLYP
jgi:hypothetical protein